MDKQLPAISVKNLHKEFVLPQHKSSSLKQAFVALGRKNIKIRQKVLDGISFEINKGEFFGIVGRNGSGKSTLLKILAGVYHPTSGTVDVNGELTPFIELGVGFNPELSGRDNIFLNGALLGFSRKEMEAMYDEIVAFAELERFMDQKLKNYSSGMQVRLAFSIAIKAHNDILIFDEVLAVGDEAFQQKCINVFESYKQRKQTVVLVTHDMEMAKKFCTRAMLVHDGKVLQIGNSRSVAAAYSKLNQAEIDKETATQNAQQQNSKYLKAKLLDADGKIRSRFDVGDRMLVDVTWEGLPAEKIESIGISIFKRSGEHVTGINSRFSGHKSDWKERGHIGLEFQLNITPGEYFIFIEAFEVEGRPVDAILEGPRFSISRANIKWSGIVELPYIWREDK
jgi:ABC-type polysaccharide/polyol phosphate transport system ATPase subunit